MHCISHATSGASMHCVSRRDFRSVDAVLFPRDFRSVDALHFPRDFRSVDAVRFPCDFRDRRSLLQGMFGGRFETSEKRKRGAFQRKISDFFGFRLDFDGKCDIVFDTQYCGVEQR